jgi:cation diffusion facilitator family transporter
LESGADVLSGLVVFFGLKIAIKPPDRDHPYGHGKAEPIAALCVGLSLVAAAVTIMVESIHEILTPHRLPAPYTLVVLAGVLIVKGLLFRHVGSVGDSIGSLAVRSDAAHHRSDAITSAFAFVQKVLSDWEQRIQRAGPGQKSHLLHSLSETLRKSGVPPSRCLRRARKRKR